MGVIGNMRLQWTRWREVEDSAEHKGPAVYRIRIKIGGHPAHLRRFLDTDAAGILSVGMTGNMDARRKQFIRGLARGAGHSEGNLLWLLVRYSRLRRKLGSFVLQYQYASTRSREAAGRFETTLLKKYVKRFGEVPPLNSVIPSRYDKGGW